MSHPHEQHPQALTVFKIRGMSPTVLEHTLLLFTEEHRLLLLAMREVSMRSHKWKAGQQQLLHATRNVVKEIVKQTTFLKVQIKMMKSELARREKSRLAAIGGQDMSDPLDTNRRIKGPIGDTSTVSIGVSALASGVCY